MPKKIIYYLLTFLGLVVVNFTLLLSITSKLNREKMIRSVLAEIEAESKFAKQFNYSSAPFATDRLETETEVSDGRAANLKAFFRKHGSPLYDVADVIVQESDKHGFDYRLLPAIAMQESTLCRAIPQGSHNCWGWGIYGDNVIKFSSYEEGIKVVAEGIKKEYLDKGLTTASKIMAKYTPSSNSWSNAVNKFLRDLE